MLLVRPSALPARGHRLLAHLLLTHLLVAVIGAGLVLAPVTGPVNGAVTGPAAAAAPAARPDAPGALSVTPGRSRADVTWTVPADNGAPISSYNVTALALNGTHWSHAVDIDVDGQAPPGTAMGYSFTRLDTHTTYTIIVTAINAMGQGPSAESGEVSPRGAPDAPGSVAITTGNGTLQVTWSAPASDGGSPVVGYTVDLTPPGDGTPVSQDLGPTATTASFVGLTNGRSHEVSIVATNALGASVEARATAIPASVPGTASRVSATRGDQRATVRWTAPTADGGAPITGYRITASPGGLTRTASARARSLAFTGLTNGTRYTFTVAGINTKGVGTASGRSPAVVPAGPPARTGRPGATAGRGAATVTWRAPAANGSAVTRFQVRCSNGVTRTVSAGARSLQFTGLSGRKRLSFQVRGINAAGTGPYSAASAIVTIR